MKRILLSLSLILKVPMLTEQDDADDNGLNKLIFLSPGVICIGNRDFSIYVFGWEPDLERFIPHVLSAVLPSPAYLVCEMARSSLDFTSTSLPPA